MKKLISIIVILLILIFIIFIMIQLFSSKTGQYQLRYNSAEDKMKTSLEMLDSYDVGTFKCDVSEDLNALIFTYNFQASYTNSEGVTNSFNNWGIFISFLDQAPGSEKSYMSQDIQNDIELKENYERALINGISCSTYEGLDLNE